MRIFFIVVGLCGVLGFLSLSCFATPAGEAPWSVTYHDGSANESRFWREVKDGKTHYEYSPTLPENSSTGTYHGGVALKDSLNEEQAGELWRWVKKLEGDPTLRTELRAKGTGAFRVKDGTGVRDFIIMDGPHLRKFEEFLNQFRKRPLS